MITFITILSTILYTLLKLGSGFFDCYADFSKSNTNKFIKAEYWTKYKFYFYSGDIMPSGWVFKWKDGEHDITPAYKGASSYRVQETDFSHFAEYWQRKLTNWANIVMTLTAFMLGWYAAQTDTVLYYVECIIVLLLIVNDTTDRSINRIGFYAVWRNKIKFVRDLGYWVQGIAISKFLKQQRKYSPERLDRYLSKTYK